MRRTLKERLKPLLDAYIEDKKTSMRAISIAVFGKPDRLTSIMRENPRTRTIKDGDLLKLAAFLGVPITAILDAPEGLALPTPLKITEGVVTGPSGTVSLAQAAGGPLNFITPPLTSWLGTMDEFSVITVEGDALAPMYRDGDALYYNKGAPRDLSALVDVECVVSMKDGRLLLRTPRRSNDGTPYLESPLGVAEFNREVEWAAQIEVIHRRKR